MEIKQYSKEHNRSCIQIFDSNTPRYFAEDEQEGLELWLGGRNTGYLAYKNTVAEHFYVMEDNGLVVACCGYYIIGGSQVANLVWGMVQCSLHNKGFGKKLFEFRIKEIKNKYPGFKVLLDTTQHTYQFFEKQGFSTTQIRKDFYGPGLDRYDMIF